MIHRRRADRAALVQRGEVPGAGQIVLGVGAELRGLAGPQHLVANRPHFGGGYRSHAPAQRGGVRDVTRPGPVGHGDCTAVIERQAVSGVHREQVDDIDVEVVGEGAEMRGALRHPPRTRACSRAS